MAGHKVYAMSFGSVYPPMLNKVERKGRSKAELDEVIRWLTGYDDAALATAIADGRTIEQFWTTAPSLNANRELIKGVVCGVRVEEVAEPLMREIRYLDKLVDELARGKAMEKVLRKP